MYTYAVEYIQIRSWGIMAAMMSFVASGSYRGIKDTATPLKAALGAAATNLVLTPLLIIGEEHPLCMPVVMTGPVHCEHSKPCMITCAAVLTHSPCFIIPTSPCWSMHYTIVHTVGCKLCYPVIYCTACYLLSCYQPSCLPHVSQNHQGHCYHLTEDLGQDVIAKLTRLCK